MKAATSPFAPYPAAAQRAKAGAPSTADGRAAEFARECVELFAEVVYALGLPRSVGQIYGLLYATPEPLSFSDIVERLEISKGSVSQGLQMLRLLGAVNIAEPFSNLSSGISGQTKREESQIRRSVAYEPELGLRKLVSGVLQERVAPLVTAGVDRLKRLRELAEGDGEGNGFRLDRVKQLETWRRRLKTILPMLGVLLGPKARK